MVIVGGRVVRGALGCLIAAAVTLPQLAGAQVFIYPRHAEKSQVRYYEFDWQHVDILVGPDADETLAKDRGPTPPTGHVAGNPTGEPPAVPANQAPAQTGESRTPPPPASMDGGTAIAAAPADAGTQLATGAPDAGMPAGPSVAKAPLPPPLGGPPAVQDPWQVWPAGMDAGTPLANGQLPSRTGGVRLFFYERERVVAERAAHIIVSSYRQLVNDFQFVPTQTFPYILYSSYQEFLQTTLSPVSEGTLGFTQTQGDLKLTLPYFGDHQLFSDVSLHEMAHQFTIQKVRHLAEQAKLQGDPLEAMPLWFIEGLAEFYAKRGIDDEADLVIRDLVTNPDPELGYALIDFWEDRPYSVLWTYQAGQIRVTFLEETYGAGIIQRILSESASLVGSGTFRRSAVDFRGLIERLTNDTQQTISKKFEAWLKRRAYRTYLSAKQDVPAVELFPEGFAIAGALNASPNGEVVLYRSYEEETGRSRLVLTDPRQPGKSHVVTVDGVPGAESLHSTFGRNFDVGEKAFVYVAEVHGRDVLYWQEYSHSAEKREPNPAFLPRGTPMRGAGPGAPPVSAVAPPPPPPGGAKKDYWEVDLDVGARRMFRLGDKGLVGAFYPSMSPDGKRVAFVGLNEDGVRDLYVLEPTGNGEADFKLTQLTRDDYAERQTAWGPHGIVYASEATPTGHYNLFRIAPEGGAPMQLTNEARDHMDPVALPDGRLMFVAFRDGRADVYEVTSNQVIRRTDLTTGVFDLSPGPDGGLWALFHYRGRRVPVQIKRNQLLSLEAVAQAPPGQPYEIARTSLAHSERYKLLALENWELDPPFGFIGAGQGSVVGQVFAQTTDRLRNHGVMLYANVYGKLEWTNGLLMYLNQLSRISWAAGLFQTISYRYDQTFPEFESGNQFVSYERYFGAIGSARYPFNPFVYLEGELTLGGAQYFLDNGTRLLLATPERTSLNRDLLTEWQAANGGTRPQTELAVRLGWDTLRWHPLTGPIGGNSILAEVTGGIQPFHGESFGNARLDAEQYFPILGRTHIMLRGAAGTAFGGKLARQFYLSSFDTIRGVPFGDTDYLLGRNFFFSTAELQVPLNSILQLIILTDLEAIAGVDFGGVGNQLQSVWNNRVLDVVVGVNFMLGPLIFRLHFARPIDTGAVGPPGRGSLPVAEGQWVTNFSLGVVGLPGFTKQASPGTLRHRSPFRF